MPKTVTYMEMTAPGDLLPAVELTELDLREADRRSPETWTTMARVGAPHGWRSATRTEQEWLEDADAHPLRRCWLITHCGETAGIVCLDPHPDGEVEIRMFGLLPEYVGRGLGGHALTLTLRQAWAGDTVGTGTVRRVWLETCTDDHPAALPNYRRRGMRPYRVEQRES